MLCIKKNKCFSTVLLLSKKSIKTDSILLVRTFKISSPPGVNPVTSTNILGVSMLVQPVETRHNPSRPVETRRNPFRSVQTRRNMLQPVETRFNPFRSVQTRFQASPPPLLHPPSPFSPLLPLFPFLFWGGGEGLEGGGGGGSHHHHHQNPPEGGGTKSPPPPDFNNNNKKQNSLTKSSNLQNLCNLPLPPRGFSQSTAAAAQNYINTYGGVLSTKNKIHSFIHCGILK